jgi:uncharacterized protein (UPF0335 family)
MNSNSNKQLLHICERLVRMEEERKKALEQHDLFDTYLHAAGLIAE